MIATLLALAPLVPGALAGDGDSSSQAEAGRRIYEEGILPDGSPLRAVRPEGFVLEGPYAACATCHRRSGMGTVEGSVKESVLVPPVAGPLLFAPARFSGTFLDPEHHWVPNQAWGRALTRSAYDEKSLGRAVREGVDPDGHALVAPMPRYALDDGAVSALAAYLRGLSAAPAPGVEPATLHLATVLTPDVPPEQADAVVGVVRTWVASSRALAKTWKLHLWRLSGPPRQWEQELNALYREQPVFAVLSGAGAAEWGPVQRFCEANRVPCVLPSVEVAPADENHYYSVYFSPGVTLEGEVLDSFLKSSGAAGQSARKILQVYSDASGKAAAAALSAQMGLNGGAVTPRRYRFTAPSAALKGTNEQDAVVLWLRPQAIAQLVETQPEGLDAEVYLSTLLAPPEEVSLPPAWKARVHYVTLFDDLGVQGEIARLRLAQWLDRHGLTDQGSLRAQSDAYAACYLFSSALSRIERQEVRRPPAPLSREHLLEMLETVVNKYADGTDWVDPDSHVAFYGRMSLGPDQRRAARGGMLLRYGSPDGNKLVPASDRIVP